MRRHVEGLRASLGETRDVNPGYFIGDVAEVEGFAHAAAR